MSPLYVALILVGLALVAYGLVAYGSWMLRALAIAIGVVIFLIGLAFHDDPRGMIPEGGAKGAQHGHSIIIGVIVALVIGVLMYRAGADAED